MFYQTPKVCLTTIFENSFLFFKTKNKKNIVDD